MRIQKYENGYTLAVNPAEYDALLNALMCSSGTQEKAMKQAFMGQETLDRLHGPVYTELLQRKIALEETMKKAT